MSFFVHDSAVVDEQVTIGTGTKVWHFSHIMTDAVIGDDCTLGQNVFVGKGVVIGNNVKIQNNVSVYQGVVLEDDVFCGPSVVFTNVMNPRSAYPASSDRYLETIVHTGASLGANATIVCGNDIGPHSFVGAGAVVTSDIPAYALYFGHPASFRGWICACGKKLSGDKTFVCEQCGVEYIEEHGALQCKEG